MTDNFCFDGPNLLDDLTLSTSTFAPFQQNQHLIQHKLDVGPVLDYLETNGLIEDGEIAKLRVSFFGDFRRL